MSFYHPGSRHLQDRYDGRRLADRLEAVRVRTAFTDADRAIVEAAPFFFLATAAHNMVDCSFRGGDPGFVRIVGDNLLEFPDYDGNSMYRSLGNILESPPVGMLFIRFDGRDRLRINGEAAIEFDHKQVAAMHGAKSIVRVKATHIYSNCPRYIPQMRLEMPSPFVPRPGEEAPAPAWKSRDYARDVLPRDGDRDNG